MKLRGNGLKISASVLMMGLCSMTFKVSAQSNNGNSVTYSRFGERVTFSHLHKQEADFRSCPSTIENKPAAVVGLWVSNSWEGLSAEACQQKCDNVREVGRRVARIKCLQLWNLAYLESQEKCSAVGGTFAPGEIIDSCEPEESPHECTYVEATAGSQSRCSLAQNSIQAYGNYDQSSCECGPGGSAGEARSTQGRF